MLGQDDIVKDLDELDQADFMIIFMSSCSYAIAYLGNEIVKLLKSGVDQFAF